MARRFVFMLVLPWGGKPYIWLSPVIMAMNRKRHSRGRWRSRMPESPRAVSCRFYR